MSWGSFILGMLSGGIVFGSFSIVLGYLVGSTENKNPLWIKSLITMTNSNLERGKGIECHFMIGPAEDDDGDGFEGIIDPPYDECWRNN